MDISSFFGSGGGSTATASPLSGGSGGGPTAATSSITNTIGGGAGSSFNPLEVTLVAVIGIIFVLAIVLGLRK